LLPHYWASLKETFIFSLDADFCVAAVEEAITKYGIPAIFNTDQGCQYSSDAFIGMLKSRLIEVNMSGKGRALDNVYVEWL
jgi:putative transposase